ncbi:MAG: EAL domain-containing protein [Burkholderiaceae bacterium]|nr:EAL domain-containing protein [Burkholderiaceae bacterium]
MGARLQEWLRESPSARAGLALLPPLLALLVQWSLWAYITPYVWFMFFPAVFASSWIGGTAAGLRATALSALLVWWLFIPPVHQFDKGGHQALLPLLVFCFMGLAFSLSHARLRSSEQRLRSLFDQASDGIFVADLAGQYVDVNRAGCEMLGYTRGELIGKSIADLIPPGDLPRLTQSRQRLIEGVTEVAEWTLRRKDGSRLPVEVSATILRNGQWQAFVRDISERHQSQAQMLLAATVFESTNEAVMVTDDRPRLLKVNRAFTAITGYESGEVLGRDPSLLSSGLQDETFYRQLWAVLAGTGQWQGEIINRRKNGEVFPAWENISAVKDAGGRITHYVAVLSDITPLKHAEERLSHMAHHDPLTGLPNRLMFSGSLQQSISRARRHGHRLALLFIDLDRFKLVNDSMGHAAGDELLKEIGRRLKHAVRAEDLVTRLGGDEFTVALEEVDSPELIATLVQKMMAEITRPLTLAGRDIVISASVGIALFPDDADTVDNLTKAADAAMYRAKERGRNTYAFYTSEITDSVHERMAIESGLRQALARDELLLLYQPQFDAATRRLVGAEALLRWRHPERGLLLPDRFIAVAEESDLISAIGAWVIRQACAQARAWLDAGLAPLRIAVNVSARQVLHDHLVETVAEALRVNRLHAGNAEIEVEITESILQAAERSGAVLQCLRALGLRVAIDDFGTGYSSLSLLKHLPIDTLKIDRLFVRNIPDDADAKAITGAVISMAHTLGLRVVAEGVETEAQLAFLHGEGCDEVQGYLLGKPMPPEQLARLLPASAPLKSDAG